MNGCIAEDSIRLYRKRQVHSIDLSFIINKNMAQCGSYKEVKNTRLNQDLCWGMNTVVSVLYILADRQHKLLINRAKQIYHLFLYVPFNILSAFSFHCHGYYAGLSKNLLHK